MFVAASRILKFVQLTEKYHCKQRTHQEVYFLKRVLVGLRVVVKVVVIKLVLVGLRVVIKAVVLKPVLAVIDWVELLCRWIFCLWSW